MLDMERARSAGWKIFADAVAETVGFATPLHRAALKAQHGRDPHGKLFYAEAAKLPADDRDRLWARLKELDANREKVAREYADRGLV